MPNNALRNRVGTGGVVAATKADTGVDPMYTARGSPRGIILSADGSVKMTMANGDIVTLALLGKVQYDYRPTLVWNTGTSAITVYLQY